MGSLPVLRATIGWVGLAAIPMSVVALFVGHADLALLGFVLAGCVPTLTAILHLNITKAMSASEKAVWHRELSWSVRVPFVVWTYLLSRDLSVATRGLTPERR